MLRADLHVHTRYSPDSTSSPAKIIARCLKIGINCLAVTDHNSIAGALELKRIAPFTIIIGEEVLTTNGEIIGLFLSRHVPHHLSPQETVAQIKAQGGLVCIPHPCDRFRRSVLRPQALERILPDIDLIEIFNSRTVLLRDSARARQLALDHGIPGIAGSDAHTLQELGNACVELPEFNDARHFMQALKQGHVLGRRTQYINRPIIHLHSFRARLVKRLKRG